MKPKGEGNIGRAQGWPGTNAPVAAPASLASLSGSGNEERLALALTAAATSIWDYDMASGLITFDAGWSRMLGGPAEETHTTIRKVFSLVHPEERAGALQSVQDCLAGRQDGYDREYRIKGVDGGWVWIHSRGRVTARDHLGRALRLIGTNTNVTERKRTELALARNAEFLAALHQTTLDVLERRSKHEILEALALQATVLLSVDQVEIALREGDVLVTRAGAGQPPPPAGKRQERTASSVFWQAMDRLEPVIVPPPPESRAVHPAPPMAGPVTFAAFPILLHQRALGVLGLSRRGPGPAFTPEEQRKCLHLAQLAALAIHNASIYEDAVRLADERAADLRERELQYQQVVENINQGFYTANARSIFTHCNPAISLVTGFRPEELVGTSSFRLVAAVDRERIIALYRNWAAGTEKNAVAEFRVDRPGGQIWVEQLTQIVRRSDGRVAEFRNFLRDITERKAATDALRESEERFHSVFDQSPVSIALLSLPDGRIVEINATAEAAFGTTLAEVRGRTSVELGLWADPADRERYLAALQAHGHVPAFEARMRRKDGTEFTALYSGSVVTIGGRRYSLNSIQDITERIQAEEALRESEARFRALSDVSPVGIFSTDAAGRTIFVNQRWCEIAGLAAEQALGDAWIKAVHPDDRAALAAGWTEAVRAGTPTSVEFRFLKPDGTVTHLVGHSRPQRLGNGPITGHVGTITDITSLRQAEEEKKRAEARLRQSQKMESLGTLAGGIAHDFNNILTGILGFAQLSLSDLEPDHPARQWSAGILRSGDRAKALVQQILAFSRKTESSRSPLRLQTVVQESAALLHSTLPAMVCLDPRCDPACPLVLADATEIHQVILNLCTNAWHALPDQAGLIEITLAPAEVSPEFAADHPPLQPGLHACLTVRDNGRGMSAATLERIFEPFFTTKEVGKGTGLGLAVVHSIVTSHAGAITVASTPGEGTCFAIFLPALAGTAPAGSSRAVTPSALGGHGQKILVVDDDHASGTVIAGILQRLGYQSTFCPDPLEAADLLDRKDFDLLVTDLAMPGLPGDQLARLAMAHRPGLPVLLVSGFIEPAKLEELRISGVREVLLKPPEYQELADAVRRCLLR